MRAGPTTTRCGPSGVPARRGGRLRIAGRALVLSMLLSGTLLSGCLATTTPRTIGGAGTPWTEADSDSWVLRKTGCGFCSGDPGVAEHTVLVVHGGAEVLRFHYGHGDHENRTGIAFHDGFGGANGSEDKAGTVPPALQGAILDALGRLGIAPRNHTLLLVHDATALLLPEAEKDRVHLVIRSNLRHAIDPGEPDLSGTADMAPTRILVQSRTPEDDTWDVRLNAHDHGNDAWAGILDQLQEVDRWLQDQETRP